MIAAVRIGELEFQRLLAVIEPAGTGVPPVYDLARLEARVAFRYGATVVAAG